VKKFPKLIGVRKIAGRLYVKLVFNGLTPHTPYTYKCNNEEEYKFAFPKNKKVKRMLVVGDISRNEKLDIIARSDEDKKAGRYNKFGTGTIEKMADVVESSVVEKGMVHDKEKNTNPVDFIIRLGDQSYNMNNKIIDMNSLQFDLDKGAEGNRYNSDSSPFTRTVPTSVRFLLTLGYYWQP
jgi:hypothetical protein